MKFIRSLFYRLPPSLRFMARRIFYLPQDIFGNSSSENGIKLPPRGLIYTGGGDFLEAGKRFASYFVRYAGLRSDSKVLDIGSGMGRMAIPLTQIISKEGKYEGFDAVEYGVRYCMKNIHSIYKQFHFQYIPLSNDLYRKSGLDPSNFRFPYPDNEFDLCILISVFTHMLPEELNNYLQEISRVLLPGKICFASFFVIDNLSESAMQKGNFQFKFNMGDHFLFDPRVKAANVAYPKPILESKFSSHGLSIDHFFRGSWSGTSTSESLDFQDIYVLSKKKHENQ